MREALLRFGYIKDIRLYTDITSLHPSLRGSLQASGVHLIDVPRRTKDAADKMILADIILFAVDNQPPATIVLISGDRDYAYALAKLAQRQYQIVLVIPPQDANEELKTQANLCLDWRQGDIVFPHIPLDPADRVSVAGQASAAGPASAARKSGLLSRAESDVSTASLISKPRSLLLLTKDVSLRPAAGTAVADAAGAEVKRPADSSWWRPDSAIGPQKSGVSGTSPGGAVMTATAVTKPPPNLDTSAVDGVASAASRTPNRSTVIKTPYSAVVSGFPAAFSPLDVSSTAFTSSQSAGSTLDLPAPPGVKKAPRPKVNPSSAGSLERPPRTPVDALTSISDMSGQTRVMPSLPKSSMDASSTRRNAQLKPDVADGTPAWDGASAGRFKSTLGSMTQQSAFPASSGLGRSLSQQTDDDDSGTDDASEIGISSRFAPLQAIISRLCEHESRGEVELAMIGEQLRKWSPRWMEELRVRKLKDYVMQAQEEGIINIRPDGLQNYVSLPPAAVSGAKRPALSRGSSEPTGANIFSAALPVSAQAGTQRAAGAAGAVAAGGAGNTDDLSADPNSELNQVLEAVALLEKDCLVPSKKHIQARLRELGVKRPDVVTRTLVLAVSQGRLTASPYGDDFAYYRVTPNEVAADGKAAENDQQFWDPDRNYDEKAFSPPEWRSLGEYLSRDVNITARGRYPLARKIQEDVRSSDDAKLRPLAAMPFGKLICLLQVAVSVTCWLEFQGHNMTVSMINVECQECGHTNALPAFAKPHTVLGDWYRSPHRCANCSAAARVDQKRFSDQREESVASGLAEYATESVNGSTTPVALGSSEDGAVPSASASTDVDRLPSLRSLPSTPDATASVISE